MLACGGEDLHSGGRGHVEPTLGIDRESVGAARNARLRLPPALELGEVAPIPNQPIRLDVVCEDVLTLVLATYRVVSSALSRIPLGRAMSSASLKTRPSGLM